MTSCIIIHSRILLKQGTRWYTTTSWRSTTVYWSEVYPNQGIFIKDPGLSWLLLLVQWYLVVPGLTWPGCNTISSLDLSSIVLPFCDRLEISCLSWRILLPSSLDSRLFRESLLVPDSKLEYQSNESLACLDFVSKPAQPHVFLPQRYQYVSETI